MTFVLNSQVLTGFKDIKNMSSEGFSLNLREIDSKKGVMQIKKALYLHKINDKIWSDFKNKSKIKSDEKCCIIIPLKSKENEFICMKEKSCEGKVFSWIKNLNSLSKKNDFVENYPILANLEKIDCEKSEGMLVIKERIENISNYQENACKELKVLSEDYDEDDCIKDSTDDITQEIRMITKNDRQMMDSIEECIKEGKIKAKADALGGTYF